MRTPRTCDELRWALRGLCEPIKHVITSPLYSFFLCIELTHLTASNVDTSARVHTTARTCVSLYNSLADPNLVASNKHEFRAIKEEIALGLGRPFSELGISYETRGLPAIVTNTAVINSGKADDLMRWYVKFYDCRSRRERVEHAATSCTVKGQKYYPSELYFAGIVISDGEADPMVGDTALTLMIGGKITIMNGAYALRVNDRVQWYFEEEHEAGVFDAEGLRVKRRAGENSHPIEYVNPVLKDQKKVRDFSYAERALMKRPAFIKACSVGLDGEGCTRGDESRVFAMCCSNAGPYERYAFFVHSYYYDEPLRGPHTYTADTQPRVRAGST